MFVTVFSGDFNDDRFLLNPQCNKLTILNYVTKKTGSVENKLIKACDWYCVERQELENTTVDLCETRTGKLCKLFELENNMCAEDRFEHRGTYLVVVLDRPSKEVSQLAMGNRKLCKNPDIRTVIPLMTSCDMIWQGVAGRIQPDLRFSKLKLKEKVSQQHKKFRKESRANDARLKKSSKLRPVSQLLHTGSSKKKPRASPTKVLCTH